MGKQTSIVAFFVLLFFIGCTPTSENVARRAQTSVDVQQPSMELADIEMSRAARARLDPNTAAIIQSYGTTIKQYSEKYGFDWRLIMAVMRQESAFSIDAESYRGAQGLMQIMPTTGDEVARALEIEDMAHPRNNIRGGIFYLKRMYDLFDTAEEGDRIRLSLAAYNAGPGRVYDAQDIAAYLREDPRTWQSVKDALPLLSKRYYTLHKNLWGQERPRAGFFGNSRETVQYVENVMSYYDTYRGTLN